MPYEYKVIHWSGFQVIEIPEDGESSGRDEALDQIAAWVPKQMERPENDGWEIVNLDIAPISHNGLVELVAILLLRRELDE